MPCSAAKCYFGERDGSSHAEWAAEAMDSSGYPGHLNEKQQLALDEVGDVRLEPPRVSETKDVTIMFTLLLRSRDMW